jgi:hypothetical protein
MPIRAARELTYEFDPVTAWRSHTRSAPARVLGRGPVCPREALAAAVARDSRTDVNFASLSRMLGRRNGYLACFIREGHPLALSERDHRMLANFFGLPERALGVRELWLPMADAA